MGHGRRVNEREKDYKPGRRLLSLRSRANRPPSSPFRRSSPLQLRAFSLAFSLSPLRSRFCLPLSLAIASVSLSLADRDRDRLSPSLSLIAIVSLADRDRLPLSPVSLSLSLNQEYNICNYYYNNYYYIL
ncbi:unnamed protein product [Camellia sinensis]